MSEVLDETVTVAIDDSTARDRGGPGEVLTEFPNALDATVLDNRLSFGPLLAVTYSVVATTPKEAYHRVAEQVSGQLSAAGIPHKIHSDPPTSHADWPVSVFTRSSGDEPSDLAADWGNLPSITKGDVLKRSTTRNASSDDRLLVLAASNGELPGLICFSHTEQDYTFLPREALENSYHDGALGVVTRPSGGDTDA